MRRVSLWWVARRGVRGEGSRARGAAGQGDRPPARRASNHTNRGAPRRGRGARSRTPVLDRRGDDSSCSRRRAAGREDGGQRRTVALARSACRRGVGTASSWQGDTVPVRVSARSRCTAESRAVLVESCRPAPTTIPTGRRQQPRRQLRRGAREEDGDAIAIERPPLPRSLQLLHQAAKRRRAQRPEDEIGRRALDDGRGAGVVPHHPRVLQDGGVGEKGLGARIEGTRRSPAAQAVAPQGRSEEAPRSPLVAGTWRCPPGGARPSQRIEGAAVER